MRRVNARRAQAATFLLDQLQGLLHKLIMKELKPMRKTFLALTVAALVAGLGPNLAHAQESTPKDNTTTDSLPLAERKAASRAAEREAAKGLSVVGAWSRATPGGAKNGAVFLEIKAGADSADRLLKVSSTVADILEIHTHLNDGGIMKMRKVDAIEIVEGSGAKLVPGGDHIMLMGLKQPLKAGEAFKLKLVFEKAGAIDVDVTVRSNTAAPGKGASGSQNH